MHLSKAQLPDDLIETLSAIFKKLKKIEPDLTESMFLENIIYEWLELYRRGEEQKPKQRKQVKLRNDLKRAFKMSNKSITDISNEIGVNRVYLSQIASGRYEPSIAVALLLAEALDYQRVRDLFYLEPVREE